MTEIAELLSTKETGTTTNTLSDATERARALNITESFIVQAPAGSGKTELLIQRYLALLSVAQKPEEILAITFTKKAASEMRTRIRLALQGDESALKTAATRDLVSAVREQDQRHAWQLSTTTQRLRIMTIDAFCHSLVAQLPILSGFGGMPTLLTNPEPVYQRVIEILFADISANAPWSEAMKTLLLHLDNHWERVNQLLIAMLGKRDQWLPPILQVDASATTDLSTRAQLELTLKNTVMATLATAQRECPEAIMPLLLNVARFAASQIMTRENCPPDHPLLALKDLSALPQARLEDLPLWHALQQLLQTNKYQFRKQVTIREGFPAPSNSRCREERALWQEMKIKMTSLLNTLNDYPAFETALANVAHNILPKPHYTDEQWQVLAALITVLKHASALLQLEWQKTGQADFIAIMHLALTALGDAEFPTDLALHLDTQLKHILVDEFQDTSHSQYRLLEQLTAGWETGDGRTLFLVGDPMQSIYRFRQAEVGLFLHAKANGLGQIHLTPLTLTSNFRSEPAIVQWNNTLFSAIFPKRDNMLQGQVAFTPSHPRPLSPEQTALKSLSQIYLECIESAHDWQERLVAVVKEQRAQQKTVAILVRARQHLSEILPLLEVEAIPTIAVEITTLAEKPVINDLLALTRALTDPADRLAWFAVLRAPWCGLSLAALLTLAQKFSTPGIAESLAILLANWSTLAELFTPADQQRLRRVAPLLLEAQFQRQRLPLAQFIETTWLALGGAAACQSATDLKDAASFFNAIQDVLIENTVFTCDALVKALWRSYANTLDSAENPVQVMTIHKAKGLEFDCVIIPGLEKSGRVDTRQLLLFLETNSTTSASSELLMAPIKSSAEQEDDALYRYIRAQDRLKEDEERCRLLYVAATRAKSCLYLLAQTNQNAKPTARSFWELCKRAEASVKINYIADTEALLAESANQTNDPHEVSEEEADDENVMLQPAPTQLLRRLSLTWTAPKLITRHELPAITEKIGDDATLLKPGIHQVLVSEFESSNDYFQDLRKKVGTLIHRWLYELALQASLMTPQNYLAEFDPSMQMTNWLNNPAVLAQHFWQVGIPREEFGTAKNLLIMTITQVAESTRLRWLLSPAHHAAHQEWALLTKNAAGEFQKMIIDRTFVDEHNIRWIIDYKIAQVPATMSVEEFYVTQKSLYSTQLMNYAQALADDVTSRQIKFALYFPLFDGWIEWNKDNN